MGSDVIVDNRYGYDGNGNRMFRHTMSGHTTYRYDERNRLVEEMYPELPERKTKKKKEEKDHGKARDFMDIERRILNGKKGRD